MELIAKEAPVSVLRMCEQTAALHHLAKLSPTLEPGELLGAVKMTGIVGSLDTDENVRQAGSALLEKLMEVHPYLTSPPPPFPTPQTQLNSTPPPRPYPRPTAVAAAHNFIALSESLLSIILMKWVFSHVWPPPPAPQQSTKYHKYIKKNVHCLLNATAMTVDYHPEPFN